MPVKVLWLTAQTSSRVQDKRGGQGELFQRSARGELKAKNFTQSKVRVQLGRGEEKQWRGRSYTLLVRRGRS